MMSSTLIAVLILAASLAPPASAPGETEPQNPGPRWGHAFVFDPIREETLLFGGSAQRGTYLDDTWTWDGSRWRRHPVPGPSPRGFAAAAFEPGRGVVLHGGRTADGRTLPDTWVWDGGGWRRLAAGGPFRADHHRLVFHGVTERLVAFGGWDGEDVLGGTWALEGEAWRQLAASGPRKRAAFGMAWDPTRRAAILYGGLWVNGQYADLWELGGSSWRPLAGPYDHSSLDHHAMVYDEARRQTVGFGGKDYRYRLRGVTFTVREGRIEELSREGPAPRHSVGLTYDAARRVVVLYGGKVYRGEEQVALGDLWLWDGAAWTERSPRPASALEAGDRD